MAVDRFRLRSSDMMRFRVRFMGWVMSTTMEYWSKLIQFLVQTHKSTLTTLFRKYSWGRGKLKAERRGISRIASSLMVDDFWVGITNPLIGIGTMIMDLQP